MAVLIFKNIPLEGPGTIEDFLKEERIPYRILELSKGEQLPDIEGYSHLVVMGGPMAVYEMDRYPYLRNEADMIESFIDSGKAVLGICLGAQMVAHVLGAKVYPGGVKEIGWYRVEITPAGMEDPVFSTLAVDDVQKIGEKGPTGEAVSSPRVYAEVFQWHGDTFDLPRGAVRIASSEVYPNQAFRYGSRVYALQFHIEVTPEIIREWFEGEEGFDVGEMLKETYRIYPEYHTRATNFYKQFFS